MIVYLDGKETEIPDQSPTPRVIKDDFHMYVITTDNQYISVAWFNNQTGVLYKQSGSIVLS